MNRVLLLSCACLIFTSACAPRYNITLTSGTVVTAKGRPRLEKGSGVYRYTDANGKEAIVPSVRVREIAPAH